MKETRNDCNNVFKEREDLKLLKTLFEFDIKKTEDTYSSVKEIAKDENVDEDIIIWNIFKKYQLRLINFDDIKHKRLGRIVIPNSTQVASMKAKLLA